MTPAPTAALTLGLGATPPPAANALTQPSSGLATSGKPAGFGGFGDTATTPAPTAPALGTALGGGSGAAQGSSGSLLGGLPKGISTGGGLGSASAATPPPSMLWNGKMPGGGADPSTNGQFSLQPGGGGRPAKHLCPLLCHGCLIAFSLSFRVAAHAVVACGDQPAVHQWGSSGYQMHLLSHTSSLLRLQWPFFQWMDCASVCWAAHALLPLMGCMPAAGFGGNPSNPRGEPWGRTMPAPTPPPTTQATSTYSGAPGLGRRRNDERRGRDGGFGFGFGRRLQEGLLPAAPADRPWRAAAFGAAGGQRRLATEALLHAALADNLAVHRKDIGAARRR